MYILLGVSFEMWNIDLFGGNCHIKQGNTTSQLPTMKETWCIEILVHIYKIQFLWDFTSSPPDFLLGFCIHRDVVTSSHN